LINIHAGFDDSSDSLHRLFPRAYRRTLDIFDEEEMDEPSIRRARAVSPSSVASERADFRELSVPSESANLVTILLAAHEIRRLDLRLAFFAELRRVIARDGRIIIAEHLRNLPNFLAFGPGFVHFHARRTWIFAMRHAGLNVEREFSITPFVRVFVVRSES
jgi:ubiquinone/menaquinone biosynthesis C-methylase UbiE